MKLIEFSVKHSLFVNLLSVFLIVAGLVSWFQLRKEAFPDVSFDTIIVTTVYRGASAPEVEKLVTTKLETELREVDDIKDIYSTSIESLSTITLEIDTDAKDRRKVINDIQKAVDRVTDLPDDVDKRPIVTEITSGKIPVIKVALSGELSEQELRDLADSLKDRFEDIDGVASVAKSGWRDEQFWVEPDLAKMSDFHVSIEEIMESLRKRNLSIPGGTLRSESQEFMVRTLGEFTTKEEIEEVVIRANDQGNWLKVKDIANVRQTFEDEKILERVQGTRSITMTVIKREKGDTLRIVKKVYATIEEFKKIAPKELRLSTFYDMSFYVNRRLNVLKFNGSIGLILIVTILFLFLHPIPAIMTALGIPVAMLTTMYVMNLLGMSINLITMFGLILVLGMIVDDGIIISENVYRYLEEGMPPRQAAIKGASEVAAPVFSTVLTTIAAFSPLLFMTGLLGKFIRNIPFVIIIALSASLIEAFIILPSHLAVFCKPIHTNKKDNYTEKAHWLTGFKEWYKRILEKTLHNRYKVALGTIVLFILCLVVAKNFIPFILFGSEGVEQFAIRAEAKEGISLERMSELMTPVEQFVSQMPRQYVDAYEAIIGEASEERGYDPNAKTGSNFAVINVYLTPAQQRKETAKEIIAKLRPELAKLKESIPEFDQLYFREFKEGPPVGKAVDIRIRGEGYEVINEIAAKVKSLLSKIDGVYDVSDSYDLGSNEILINVDEEKAAAAYLSIGEVANTIRNSLEGGVATTIRRSKAEDEIKVLVRLPKSQRDTMQVFNNLIIPNKLGNLIPLKEISSVQQYKGLRTVGHLDGKRFVSVGGEVDNKKITPVKLNSILRKELKSISKDYPGYSIRFAGEQEETSKSLQSLFAAFCIAVLLIFIILATEFNSLIQPAIVLLNIPFGMIGIIFAFLIHHKPLSFLAILGVVGLTGVVVNDSIVLVDFINKLRREGMSRRDSIIQSGALRLRPVLVTTLTTVAGFSTVAYGIGGSDPFLKPMALAMSWGLIFATALTLLIMPCFYAIVDDISMKVLKHGTVFDRLNGKLKNKHSLKTKQ